MRLTKCFVQLDMHAERLPAQLVGVKPRRVGHKVAFDVVSITCEAVTSGDGDLKRWRGKNKIKGCAFVDKDIMSGCCHSVGRDE